jgi:hypothetical protein
MVSNNLICAAVTAAMACGGLGLWGVTGRPAGYAPAYIMGGVAAGAVYCVVALLALRAARGRLARSIEGTPRQWGRRLPGTRAERVADLRALEDGRLLHEEFVERWRGREIVDDDVQKIKEDIAAAVRAELERPVDPAEPVLFPCKHCLGLHTAWARCPVMAAAEPPVSGVTPYAEAEANWNEKRSQDLDIIAASAFRTGQWVRVKPGGMHHMMLVKLISYKVVARTLLWTFDSEDGPESLADACFEFASPKEDEWWQYNHGPDASFFCKVCGSHTKGTPFQALSDYPAEEEWFRLIIEGCLSPVNFGYGATELPWTGMGYVAGPQAFITGDRVRSRRDDRIYTLKTFEIIVEAPRLWTADFGGSDYKIYEPEFKLAVPTKGEVWHYKTSCATCDAEFGPVVGQSPFDVTADWENSWITRARIRCGCLYRIGMQGSKP